MVRVHEGLPAQPLPMYIPEPRQTPAPVPLPGQETPLPPSGAPPAGVSDSTITDVLNAIFGGGN
jgi:hypothetical protein